MPDSPAIPAAPQPTEAPALHRLSFWFDPISPYAWLAFDALPQVLAGHSVEVRYRPVLFAGLLKHWGQLGPAEIGPKRAWTYRDVAWRAHRQGTPLTLPPQHPFNPLPLLRLAQACALPEQGLGPSRRVVDAIFRHVWVGGADPSDAGRLAALRAQLAPAADPDSPAVRDALRAEADAAIAEGLFGVPTIVWRGQPFWGHDALPMLAAALAGDPWFAGEAAQQAAAPRAQQQRAALRAAPKAEQG